ncbi:hypothetical protein [Xenophilus sp. Marseille-Q4582]|uniref:hypothetical protein n=1 Tax=Xenophilus sp. Marseille-Q4582 TaxID=2866600 RepID=UPI001CE43AC9|nr:hypothetical protein [Xenophilus sp. Marseille-Q4582]
MLFLCPLAMAALLLLTSAAGQAQEVHRCGNRYSDTPCGAGQLVDVSPAVRNLDSAGTAQVFLCVSHGGGRFWSSMHCRQRNALVERIESVPAGLPWEQQVEIADQQTRQGYATQRRQMQVRGAGTAGEIGAGNPGTRQNCARWSEQVAQYDAMARQPNSAAMQGWIAERRKQARDAQFRAGC